MAKKYKPSVTKVSVPWVNLFRPIKMRGIEYKNCGIFLNQKNVKALRLEVLSPDHKKVKDSKKLWT